MFSDTINILLEIVHCKASYLAHALGYDESYISKWMGGKQLPSLKNNSGLFQQLSNFFLAQAGPNEKSSIRMLIGVQQAGGELSDLLENYLSLCYHKQAIEKEGCSSSYNAWFQFGSLAEAWGMIAANGQRSLAVSKGPAHIFSTLDITSQNNRDLLCDIAKWVSSEIHSVKITQLVQTANYKNHPVIFCQAVAHFLSVCPAYSELLHALENAELSEMVYVQDSFLLCKLHIPFAESNAWIYTTHPLLLQELPSPLLRTCKKLPPVFQRYKTGQESAYSYNIHYLTEPGAKYILTSMQPLFMKLEDIEKKGESLKNEELKSKGGFIYQIGLKTQKEVVIFKSVLIDYFSTHQMELYGQKMLFSQAECAAHLRYLASSFRRTGNNALYIVEDTNPVLCSKDVPFNIFLNSNSSFFTRETGNTVTEYYTIKETAIQQCFQALFEQYKVLPKEFCLSAGVALEFLEHLACLLETEKP